MNLKESFRYQKYLDSLMDSAVASIKNAQHGLVTTKTHMRNKANPDAVDEVEKVETETEFYPNDQVISFMLMLINNKGQLTAAINVAKENAATEIDAGIEENKFRQKASAAIRTMLGYVPSKRVERGTDYKFNAEGNQIPYYYDIEVVNEPAYDGDKARKNMRRIISIADKTSAAIDMAMVNTVVEYEPPFDVNDSFEDAMSTFVEKYEQYYNGEE